MILGFLGGGQLGFLVLQELNKHFVINFVLTDKKSLDIAQFCVEKEIIFFAGNPRNGRALDELPEASCDLLISVNYLFLIEKDILELPSKFAINFHGSLLPKYRGRTPHIWAIINSENEAGVTAHLMAEECDAGDIIAQLIIPIEALDEGYSILKKYMVEYPTFVMQVIKKMQDGSYQLTKQNHELATYFGKRVPEDGLINWTWQRTRICNWVRALAIPYPRAFSYCNRNKLLINEIEFSDFGFNFEVLDGTIIKIEEGMPIVKTPNGCIKLLQFQCDYDLSVGDILS